MIKARGRYGREKAMPDGKNKNALAVHASGAPLPDAEKTFAHAGLWQVWTAEALRWRLGAAGAAAEEHAAVPEVPAGAGNAAAAIPAVSAGTESGRTKTAATLGASTAEEHAAAVLARNAGTSAAVEEHAAAADIPSAVRCAAAGNAPAEARETMACRAARAAVRGGWAACVTLGAEAAFLRRLRALLPPDFPLLALETDMACARRCAEAAPEFPLLADVSPWALLCLTLGLLPEPVMLCRAPAAERSAEAQAALNAFRRLHTGARAVPPAPAGRLPSLADISIGCIMHPAEPHLAEFFQHIPAEVREVAVVWDGAAPDMPPAASVPVRHAVRPLAGDFAAQRNVMLSLLSGRWVLYLDADERLCPQDWARLPELLARMEARGLDGLLLPRRTYEGREGQVRMGFGLWPDVQLRLFRRTESVRFTGAVHERLEGLRGGIALTLDVSLRHFSHIWKDAAQLSARLKIFDAAAGSPLRHHLNGAYPALPEIFFAEVAARQPGGLWALNVR